MTKKCFSSFFASQVYHFDNDHHLELVPGMVFTIEPILVEGSGTIEVWPDNWTAVTTDGGRYSSTINFSI